jgi:hypothetical protein
MIIIKEGKILTEPLTCLLHAPARHNFPICLKRLKRLTFSKWFDDITFTNCRELKQDIFTNAYSTPVSNLPQELCKNKNMFTVYNCRRDKYNGQLCHSSHKYWLWEQRVSETLDYNFILASPIAWGDAIASRLKSLTNVCLQCIHIQRQPRVSVDAHKRM